MSDKAYWNQYYQFWDEFVKKWYDSGANPTDKITQLFKKASEGSKDTELNLDELPEPYLGNPDKGVKAVFINLNPGMAQKGSYGKYKDVCLEQAKFFSHQYKEIGWLMKEFVNSGCSYRKFLDKWSALNPELQGHDPEVCGVKWWTGPKGRTGRMDWVRRIYKDPNLSSLDVFAPELCPYHSKNWSSASLNNEDILNFMRIHVLQPALKAVKENDLPFVIGVGSAICDMLDNFAAVMEREWRCNRQILNNAAQDMQEVWPKKRKNGKFITRSYRLYKIGMGRVLVSWASGGNYAPDSDFEGVEEYIRTYVKENPLQ